MRRNRCGQSGYAHSHSAHVRVCAHVQGMHTAQCICVRWQRFVTCRRREVTRGSGWAVTGVRAHVLGAARRTRAQGHHRRCPPYLRPSRPYHPRPARHYHGKSLSPSSSTSSSPLPCCRASVFRRRCTERLCLDPPPFPVSLAMADTPRARSVNRKQRGDLAHLSRVDRLLRRKSYQWQMSSIST